MAGPTLELDISTDGVVRGGRVASNVLEDIAKSASFTALQLQKLNSNFDKSAKGADNLTRQARGMKKEMSSLRKVVGLAAGAFAGFQFLQFSRDALNARLELNRMELSLRSITGSSAEAAKQLRFVRNTASQLGLDFRGVAGSYSQLLASAKSVNISTEVTQKLFKNVSSATRALGLSTDQTKGAFLAFSQILSKNKLSMEEIRQQLGERIPGAMGIFADALGISVQEFDKLVSSGKLMAEDVIPLVADEFGKFTKDAQKASGDLQSKFNELNTAWFDFQTTVLDGGLLDGIKQILTVTKEMVKALSDGSRELGKLFARSDQAQARILARMKKDPNMRPGPGGVDLFGTQTESDSGGFSTGIFPSSDLFSATPKPELRYKNLISSTMRKANQNMRKKQRQDKVLAKARAGGKGKKKKESVERYDTPFIDDFFDLSQYADGGISGMMLEDELKAMEKLEKEGRSLVERYQTVEQRLNATKARAKELRRAGVITEKEYTQISEQISSQFEELEEKSVESFNVMEQAMQGWANSFTDTFVDALTGAQSSFSGFVNSILKDLLRLSVQQNITKPLFDSLGGGGGFLGKLFGGSKHSGGVVPGRPGEERLMMLQAGERVISNGQNQAMAKSGGMNVNIYNNSGAQVQATQRQGSNGVELDITIDKIVAEKLSSPSRSSSALKNVYGLRPKGY